MLYLVQVGQRCSSFKEWFRSGLRHESAPHLGSKQRNCRSRGLERYNPRTTATVRPSCVGPSGCRSGSSQSLGPRHDADDAQFCCHGTIGRRPPFISIYDTAFPLPANGLLSQVRAVVLARYPHDPAPSLKTASRPRQKISTVSQAAQRLPSRR